MKIGEYKGYSLYCDHGISYSCPALKERGYRDDLALMRAVRRVLKKRGIEVERSIDEAITNAGLRLPLDHWKEQV